MNLACRCFALHAPPKLPCIPRSKRKAASAVLKALDFEKLAEEAGAAGAAAAGAAPKEAKKPKLPV